MCRIRKYVSLNTAVTLFNSLVLPHFDYGSLIWGSADSIHLEPIVRLQKRAARVLLKAPRFSGSQMLFRKLKWLPLLDRIKYHTSVLMFKCINKQVPLYLSNMFHKVGHRYGTRSVSNCTLKVPKPRLEIYRSCFAYRGAVLWNSIPGNIQGAMSVSNFKTLYLSHICNN